MASPGGNQSGVLREEATISRAKFPDAAHVLHGFRYQLLQSLGAWLGLRPGEELLLEVSEDFSIRSRDTIEDVQVKASRAAAGPTGHSLNAKDVKQALDRYWLRRESGSANACRLTFVAQGGAINERDFAFPNAVAGLVYWRHAALGSDTKPIRDALKQTMAETALGRWVASDPSDRDLREHLLTKVQWALSAAPMEVLQQELREQTQTLVLSKGLPAIAGSELWRTLLDVVFETASESDATLRRLSSAKLHVLAEGMVQADAVSRAMALQNALAPATESLLIGSLHDSASPGSARSESVAAIRSAIGDQPVIWLHGAHGVGKSTLSRLLACAYGGHWLTIDLKPLRGQADGLLAVWRSLQQIILQSGLPDGVIIDDLDVDAASVLWPRVKALAQLVFDRGGRLILNSHQAPSPARAEEVGAGANVIVQAPYFSEAEVADLLGQEPAPPIEEREAWAFFIRGATGGGHPLLVAAKVSSLSARNWPSEALLEDVGPQSSEAVRATRQEARQILLREITVLGDTRSRDAGRMLRRIGSVFDRVDEALIVRLASFEPRIDGATDLLSLLRGSWLEPVSAGDLRVSPLLGDITDDVTEEEKRLWRCMAAEHWLSGRVLNERTIPLVFWNAFLGRHEWVLAKFCQVLLMQPRRAVAGAAALLAPIAAFPTEAPIYPGNTIINANLRLLQFEVAEALDKPEKAGAIAMQLFADLDAIEIAEVRTMMAAVTSSKVLMAANAKLAPRDVVRFALLVRRSHVGLAAFGQQDLVARSDAIVADLDPNMDQADFLFAGAINKVETSADFLGLVEALDAISVKDRNRFLNASASVFDGLSVLVNSGWSRDQLEDRDLQAALQCYHQAEAIVARWERPDAMIQLACAISVLHDEGLKQEHDALATIDEAIAKWGPDQALIRQKSKVLGHYDRDAEAAELLISIEETAGGDSLFDRALALRDGASSAARASRFADAARLYGKAAEAVEEAGGRLALLAGLKTDCAMATWNGGNRAGALAMLGDVFDRLGDIDAESSRQAERAHQFARGVGGLFAFDAGVLPSASRPDIAAGGASALSTDDEPRLQADLKPLADNWRILALIERETQLDIGIAERSLAKQTGPGVASIEFLFFLADYARALGEGDIGHILSAGTSAVSALRVAMRATAAGDGMVRVDRAALGAIAVGELLQDGESREAIYRIPADVLMRARLIDAWTPELVEELRAACLGAFGEDAWVDPFFKAASGRYAVGAQAPMPFWVSAVAAMSDDAVGETPSVRYQRDLLFVLQAGLSPGRRTLEPLIVASMREGWRAVLDKQRFRLNSPSQCCSDIESALGQMDITGLRAAAALLLAAAPAVQYEMTDNWTAALQRIARNST